MKNKYLRLNTKNINGNIKYKKNTLNLESWPPQIRTKAWRKCKEMDTYIDGAKYFEAWKLLRSLKAEAAYKTQIQPVKLDKWCELAEDRESYLANSQKPNRIQGRVKSLKNKRASGPEGLPAKLPKNKIQKLIAYLQICKLRNNSNDQKKESVTVQIIGVYHWSRVRAIWNWTTSRLPNRKILYRPYIQPDTAQRKKLEQRERYFCFLLSLRSSDMF